MRVFSFSDWLTNSGSEGLKNFSLSQSYQRIAWVYSCVNITASTASSAALYFYEGSSQEASNRITDPDHPVNQLFQTPKEPEIPSLRELLYKTFSYLGISGEIFWVFSRKKGQLTTLEYRIGLKPILSNAAVPKLLGWKEITANGTILTYTVQQVLPILNFNPADPYSGMSPLLAARLSIETEFNIAGWNTSFFKSGMKNPLLLQAKGTLTKNQKTEIKKEISNYYSGIEGGHGALLLQGNIDVTPLKVSPKDVDFVQGKKLNREEITSIYGVPPALVGIFEFANYANVKEQRKIFWENTLLPRMNKISDLLQTNVLNREFPGITCAWDTSQVLGMRDDPKDLATAAKTYQDMGYDAQQISVILNTPELDIAINPGSKKGAKLKPLSSAAPVAAPATTPVATPKPKPKPEEESNSLVVNDLDRFLKWAEAYSTLESEELKGSIATVETSIQNFVDKLVPFVNQGSVLKQLRWANLWEDTVGRELSKVGEEAILASVKVMKSVENQGRIETIQDIKSYVSFKTLKKLKALVHSQIQESRDIPIKVLNALEKGDSFVWNKLKASIDVLAASLVYTIRETVRHLAFQLLGVKSLIWVSKGDCHKLLHGQRIDLGKEFFSIGADHPHQKGLPLSDVIGCNCTTVPLEFLRI